MGAFDDLIEQHAGAFGDLIEAEERAREQRPGLVRELASQVGDALFYHLPGAFAAALEGDQPFAERDWKDTLIERSRARMQEVASEPGAMDPLAFGLLTREDVRSLGPSLAFSGVGAGAGLAAGVPAAIAGGALSGPAAPIAGPVAGFTAGGAASGKAAYDMAVNQFLRDARQREDELAIQERGAPLTDEEWATVQQAYIERAKEYGLWEAVPEAAGNVLGAGILLSPAKRLVPKALKELADRNILTRGATKLGALQATELPTETVTQMGQHNVEVASGLAEEGAEARSFTDPGDWWESFKEIVGPTVLQTTLMGGAGGAAVGLYRGAKKLREEPIEVVPTETPEDERLREIARQVEKREIEEIEQQLQAEQPAQEEAPAPDASISAPISAAESEKSTQPGEVPYAREREALELLRNRQRDGTLTPEDRAWAISRGYAKETPQGDIRILPAGRRRLTELDVKANEAATSPTNDLPEPTEAQKQAGNYKKGHIKVAGLDISIENPAGSKRRPEWPTLESHYGYIKGVPARAPDKDHVDVFVKPGVEDAHTGQVYVIDQQKDDGTFDEPKVMIGFDSEEEARQAYLRNYTPDWKGLRDITHMSMEEFRAKLNTPDAFLKPQRPERWTATAAPAPTQPAEQQSEAPPKRATNEAEAIEAALNTFVRQIEKGYTEPTSGTDGANTFNFGAPFAKKHEVDVNGPNGIKLAWKPLWKRAQAIVEQRRTTTEKGVQHGDEPQQLPEADEARPRPVDAGAPGGARAAPDDAGQVPDAGETGARRVAGPAPDETRGEPDAGTPDAVARASDADASAPDAGGTGAPATRARVRSGRRRAARGGAPSDAGAPDAGTADAGGRDAGPSVTAGASDAGPQAGVLEPEAPAFGASNRIFTAERAARAREILRRKLGQVSANAPLDPELIQAGIDLAGFYIEGGARKFADYAAKMVADLGEAVRPYLKSWYLAVRNYPGFDNTGMESEAELEQAEKGIPAPAEAPATEPEAAAPTQGAEEQEMAREEPREQTEERNEARATEQPEAPPEAEPQAPAATTPPERPKDSKGNPIFEKGDRVEFVSGRYAGRHGEVVQRTSMTMRPVFGGGQSETTHHYDVRTDNGVTVFGSPADMRFETARPERVVPDIKVGFHFMEPDAVWRSYQNYLRNAKKARESQARARLPAKKREWAQEAERADRNAAEMLRIFNEWAEKYPDEAKAIRGADSYQSLPAQRPDTTLRMPAPVTVTATAVTQPQSRSEAPAAGEWQPVGFNMSMGAAHNILEPGMRVRKKDGRVGTVLPRDQGKYGDFVHVHFDDQPEGRNEYVDGRALEFQAPAPSAPEPAAPAAEELAPQPAAHAEPPATEEPAPVETPPAPAENAPEATQDERASPTEEGPRPLDEVAPAEDRGVEGGRGVQRGDARRGGEGAEADRGVAPAGLPVSRGGGDRAEGAHPARAGARRGTGRLGARRARREGEGVPQSGAVESPQAPNVPGINFRITDEVRLGLGGEAQKFRDNIAAIRVLKQIEAEGRRPTPDEQRVLARYVGWGGLANAFADDKGNFKEGWEERGRELASLLTPNELRAARRSTRNAHYTSEAVIDAMWEAVLRMGFKGGLVLESSMGTGNFIGLMPEEVLGTAKVIGIEYDSLTARIAKALYPQSTVLHAGFQKVPVPDGEFDLNIGNPPFGSESLRFTSKPYLNGHSIHNQFFLAGMDALRPGGIQAMVVSRFLMDAQDKSARLEMAKRVKLLGAIRLPDTAFKENARTEVVTDILFFQRLTEAEQRVMEEAIDALRSGPSKNREQEERRRELVKQVPDWVETTKIPDPLGGEEMVVNRYFAANPDMVLGRLERSGTMRTRGEVNVRLQEGQVLEDLLEQAIERLPKNVMEQQPDAIERSKQRYESMSEALKIAVSGVEAGHIGMEDGHLVQIIERETPGGDYELTKRRLTTESPWSQQLLMDAEGRWYRLEVQLDESGKPVKVEKDGKKTKRNAYVRTVYESEADIPASMRLGEAKYERLKKIVEMRDLLKRQLQLEADDAPSDAMEGNRRNLAKAYKEFTAKHGFVNEPANAALVSEMPDGALVLALEIEYRPEITPSMAKRMGEKARPAEATPAPILKERVVVPYSPPGKAESPADALAITLSESGRVDIERIAGLLGVSQEEAIAQMYERPADPLIFRDPETNTWETRDAYLSGQVRRKLEAARAAGLTKNVEALEKVQPEPWGADKVTAILGASWIPDDVYAAFVEHITGEPARVIYSRITNSYQILGRDGPKSAEWSSPRASAIWLLSHILNSQAIRITVTDSDGKVIFLKEETTLAQLKAKQIEAEFANWVFQDNERRNRLVKIFNDKFNTRVARQFDGSHLKLPGKVPDAIIRMRRHQQNAIWRGISQRFMLLDHVVGAGKTYTAIARIMERRRMGLSKKPMVVVPNHLVEEWAASVYRLYPGAKVLAATKKDFERKRRRRLFGKIATGDWDIIILAHSSFNFIDIAQETEERFLQEELRIAHEAIDEAWEVAREMGMATGRRKPFNVKEAERLAEKIQARLDALKSKGKDRLLTFEQMGVDDLTIDEAHEFKNLFYSSRLTNVRGMNDKAGSQKAFDLYSKIRVLRESPTATVTFMTGTPISNSAVEMYQMMRYLAADELKELGLEHFDAWRAQFVDISTKWEPSESGHLQEVNRLGRTWSNMRSLMELYYSFTDVVTLDDIKKWYAEDNGGKEFPVPKVKGGDRQSVVVKPTPAQQGELQDILAGFDSLDGIKDPIERAAQRLRLMDRARKVSLDVRAVNPRHTSEEKGGKLEVAADRIAELYRKWDKDKGTQLVFLDRSVPRARGDDRIVKEYDALVAERDKALREGNEDAYRAANDKLEKYDPNEIAELRVALAGGWNAYEQLKRNLVARGIPANQIRFIQEANNDEQKQAIFDAVNAGEVRVLIGSTPRMGAGTNVQKRLVALHHIDVTWKPSDIEQREGRIIRQGNMLLEKYGEDFEVEILAYVTERTVDAKLWDVNATKLRTINGIRKYGGEFSMDFEDEESVSMAEIAALASGDPLLLERVKLESEIDRLELLERAHRRKQWGIKDEIATYEKYLRENPQRIKEDRERAAAVSEQLRPFEEEAKKRTVKVEGKEYSKHFDAMKAVLDAIEAQQKGDEKAKWSLNINGQRVTNKQAAEEAVSDALGDDDFFEAEARGKTTYRRVVVAREFASVANDLLKSLGDKKEGEASGELGTIFGYRAVVIVNKGPKTAADIALEDESGRTIVSTFARSLEGSTFSPQYARSVVDSIVDSIKRERTANTDYYESQMREAEAKLPKLREHENDPFPQQAELEEKRKRLEAVIRELAGKEKAKPTQKTQIETADKGEGGDDDDTVRFDLGGAARSGQGMGVAEVRRIVSPVAERWRNGPGVEVIASMDEAPEPVRQRYGEMRAAGAGSPGGFFFGGKVYIVADGVDSPHEVAKILFHEVEGHYGLRGAFGEALIPVLQDVVRSMPEAVRAKVREYGLDWGNEVNRLEAAEEVLAELAQRRPQANIVKRAIAAIRRFLRSVGFDLKLSENDIIVNYILPARRFVERGEAPGGAVGATAFGLGESWYFSALERQIRDLKQGSAPAEQWKATIRALKGVTKDEIEWSGINEWLDTQPGKVSKDAVLDYLAQNGVRVTETVLADEQESAISEEQRQAHLVRLQVEYRQWGQENGFVGEDLLSPEEMLRKADLTEEQYDYVRRLIMRRSAIQQGTSETDLLKVQLDALGYNVVDDEDADIFGVRRRSDGALFSDSPAAERGADFGGTLDDLPNNVRVLVDRLAYLLELAQDPYSEAHAQPRHSVWQFPAGANYRELLLTLPSVKKQQWTGPTAYEANGKSGLQWKSSDGRATITHWPDSGEYVLTVDDGRRYGRSFRSFNEAKSAYEAGETLPVTGFQSTHFDQPNILAHVRFNERTDTDGKRVLFVEEFQSDWAQTGRREGFRGADDPMSGGVPRAPFVVKTEAWVGLLLKRVIRWAAEHGFDRIAWTTGKQQVDRYDLSKHVRSIEYIDFGDGTYRLRAMDKRDRPVIEEDEIDIRRVEELIGQEMAEKVKNGEGEDYITEKADWKRLAGLNLVVGGKGQRVFYDQIVPNVANDLLKKLGGGRVGKVRIAGLTEGFIAGGGKLRPAVGEGKPWDYIEQPGFDITPEMREKALAGLPLFSLSSQFDAKVRDELDNVLTSQRTFNRWWHRTIGTQFHKAKQDPDFRRVFDLGQDYLTDTSRYAMKAEAEAPSLLLRLEGASDILPKLFGGKGFGISKADKEAIAKPIFEGTLEEKTFSDEELRALYKLNDRQIGYYREFRAAVDRSLDELAKSTAAKMASAVGIRMETMLEFRELDFNGFFREVHSLVRERARTLEQLAADTTDAATKRLHEERSKNAKEQARALVELFNRIEKLKREGYAPLMRFGEYTVYVTQEGPDGEIEQVFFGMYESQRAANAAAKALAEEYPDAEIRQGILSKDAWRVFQGLSPDTMEIFAKAAGLDQEPLFQQYLRLAVNNRSALKRLIRRKGVPGFSEDVTRVLASFVTSNARLTSSNYHLGQMQAAVDAIPKEKGDVRDEAVNLWRYLADPAEEAGALRGFLFFQYLGGSIASALVNATQPVTMTAPYLAKYASAAEVAKELSRAAMEAAKNAPGADVQAAYQRAVEEGIIAPHEIYQLMAQARGNAMGSTGMGRFMKVWGSFFSLAEAFNRRATFIAAYRIALAKGMRRPYEFAKEAVYETQGLYNKGNRPNWARGAVGATVFTFKQFSIAYVEFLKRLHDTNRPAFWLALAVLWFAAGLEGLPFAEDIEDLLDTIGQWLGYNTNSKKWLRDRTAEALGEGGGEFVLHGFSAVPGVPLDVSLRMGLHNIIPGTALFKRSEAASGKASEALEVLGPVGGVVENVGRGLEAAASGDVRRAAQAVMPLALANLFKGAEMWEKGYYTDSRGRRVMDTTGGEAILKAAGFQPASVARESRNIQIARQDVEMHRITEASIAEKWARGIVEKKPELVEEAREDLRRWNRSNPRARIVLQPQQIRRRVLEMRRSRAQRFVRHAPPEIRRNVREEVY